MYPNLYFDSPSPPRDRGQAVASTETTVGAVSGPPEAGAVPPPTRRKPPQYLGPQQRLPNHYRPGTTSTCTGCSECLGAAWPTCEELLNLGSEYRRLKKAQIELLNQLKSIEGKTLLEKEHFKRVCPHPTTLPDTEWKDNRQYQCLICQTLINGWDVINERERLAASRSRAYGDGIGYVSSTERALSPGRRSEDESGPSEGGNARGDRGAGAASNPNKRPRVRSPRSPDPN